VRIARQLPEARLVVSGPGNDREATLSHARVLADTAVSLGIARERIVEIDHAQDTEQEAVAMQAISARSTVAVVTSAWHMPRAMALCQRAGMDVVACPADYTARDAKLSPNEFLYWNLGGLERSTKAVYEMIGAAWSRLRGKA
ncbi:MAG: ElyC/SanA/YdcF family protein, partial [Rariglobus sp.]